MWNILNVKPSDPLLSSSQSACHTNNTSSVYCALFLRPVAGRHHTPPLCVSWPQLTSMASGMLAGGGGVPHSCCGRHNIRMSPPHGQRKFQHSTTHCVFPSLGSAVGRTAWSSVRLLSCTFAVGWVRCQNCSVVATIDGSSDSSALFLIFSCVSPFSVGTVHQRNVGTEVLGRSAYLRVHIVFVVINTLILHFVHVDELGLG